MASLHPLDEVEYPPFTGFPREGLAFLRRLRKNNNRPWFQKHKNEYEELVRFPMQCLIATVAPRMADAAPEITFHPRKSIFRIYRDTRFSKNKTPYKTNIGASFEYVGKHKPTENPGLYVGIEPGEIFIGGGLYMPSGEQLKRIRQRIAEEPAEFLEVIRNARFRKVFREIQGERLVKAPLGYPKDHAMIEHLRLKQLYVGVELEESACLRAGFADKVVSVFTDTMPLVRWLARAVGEA
jgi:uncharacterized protein (TIGR02453 family)